MDKKFLSPYNPKEVEERIYKYWDKTGYFNPDFLLSKGFVDKKAATFTVVLPPPNVTGNLHLGHSQVVAIQDSIIRFNRMEGNNTLWIPGTDHAAIATQSVVEKKILNKEKKTRFDLGREEFLKRVNEFATESHDVIVNQIKKLGASLDWSREAFTLDKKRHTAVMEAFKKMYEKGIIYRGKRIVNWDPKLKTVISDDEITWVEEKTPFYYLKYGPFTIGTTRPETKFGDKYVVMHPKDKRYSKYKQGEEMEVDWINGKVTAKIIKDECIDMKLGTGVMTITPWHDKTDFEIAKRHNLSAEQIIDFNGVLLEPAGEFAGKHIKKVRKDIIDKVKGKGLLIDTDENYVHNVATSSRSGEIIEPQIKEQWFVDVNKEFTLDHSEIDGINSGDKVNLKKIMETPIKTGQIEVLPDRFKKNYFHWIENLQDWCISRQIWYGHRIPAWYKNGEIKISTEKLGDGWEQDPDTFDTWFSSGLWTFSTLGWPESKKELEERHPTELLETGYDILFFWVARMILMSGFHLGQIPFKSVYLQGLIRDENGKKMSKSLGNVIDPRDIIEKYGADALRVGLIFSVTPGKDLNFSEEKIKSMKHFANKLWNISRFVLTHCEEIADKEVKLKKVDEALIEEFKDLTKEVRKNLLSFKLNISIEKLYEYIWHRLADQILEESKKIFDSGDTVAIESRKKTLYLILHDSVKALHPFMPFITEEIWQSLPVKETDAVIIAKYPK